MADDDQLDTEALQAQIDLSMSYMHGLVSSWIKPTSKPLSNSNAVAFEDELKESMRRPSRLGVGASIPDAHESNSRDVARLKDQLVGKRKRLEDDTLLKQPSQERGQLSDEDDEESRSCAIKEKAKADPFSTKVPRRSAHLASSINRETGPSVDSGKVKAGVEKSISPEMTNTGAKTPDVKNKVLHSSSKIVVPSRSESALQKPEVNAPVSPINPASHPSLPTPLLNLDGPIADQIFEEDEIPDAQAHESPSKKRRKRRKKKKSLQNQTSS